MLDRRDFLRAGAGAVLAKSSRPTNVIFILTDDQSPWTMGCYGNREIRTPVLDRLAEGGARFTRAFAATPVCSPSRATFFTGEMPCQHGIQDWIQEENVGSKAVRFLDGHTAFTQVLAHHGYKCGLIGKWHMGDSATPQQGFSHWLAIPGGSSRYQDAELISKGETRVYPGYLTEVLTDKAIEFIEQSKRDPFFCYLAYNAPHTPLTGTPEKYRQIYRDSPLETFPNEPLNPLNTGLGKANHRKRDSMITYYAMITAVDEQVGRIVRKLEETKLRQDTLIVFAGDQGFMCGQHGLWGKGNASWPFNMYEESIGMPLIWNQPGRIPPGQKIEVLVNNYDFPHTMLDYLSQPPLETKHLGGSSYAPLLVGARRDVPGRQVIFGEYQYTRMIRDERWKYVERTEDFPSELYDLLLDPREKWNLVKEPEHAERVQEMKSDLHRWFADRGCASPDAWKSTRQFLPKYKPQGAG